MIKSFRGLLADGEQDIIRLSTNNGMIGYKINKFQAIGAEPGEHNAEHTLKLYKRQQGSVDNAINFTDSNLLGMCYIQDNIDDAYPFSSAIIFDNETFNQDIFITHSDTAGSRACNYYVELEQVKLDLSEATVATLKDMRGRE